MRTAPPEVIGPIKEMLHELACTLVGNAVDVSVATRHDGDGVRFILIVDPTALKRIYGPHGRTAMSLRVILRAAGIKSGWRFRLSVQTTHRSSAGLPC